MKYNQPLTPEEKESLKEIIPFIVNLDINIKALSEQLGMGRTCLNGKLNNYIKKEKTSNLRFLSEDVTKLKKWYNAIRLSYFSFSHN